MSVACPAATCPCPSWEAHGISQVWVSPAPQDRLLAKGALPFLLPPLTLNAFPVMPLGPAGAGWALAVAAPTAGACSVGELVHVSPWDQAGRACGGQGGRWAGEWMVPGPARYHLPLP